MRRHLLALLITTSLIAPFTACKPSAPAATTDPQPLAGPVARVALRAELPMPVAQPSPPSAAPVDPALAPPAKSYGAALTGVPSQPIAAVLADPDRFAGQTISVDGTVRAACTRKGCWMELAESSAKEGKGCRVTFKDYGFFVPTDSAGASAKVEGTLAVKTISAADVQHYESEGGTFPMKAADGTAREVRIVANGVELTRR